MEEYQIITIYAQYPHIIHSKELFISMNNVKEM